MQVDSNTEVETEIDTSTSSDSVVELDTPSKEIQVSEDDTQASGTEATVSEVVDPTKPVEPAYTPNFKYSIKGKEHEIDEMFRPLIKTADDEKKVKELFEKAMGIDHVKSDRSALKSEYEGFKSQVIPHLQVLDQFTSLRDGGNLGAALKVAGVSDDMIFEYALQKLEMDQNPNLAKTYQAQQEQSIRELELQRKVAQYEQQQASSQEMSFTQELETSLGSVQDIASQVNAKFGSEDAFREEVIAYGLAQMQRGKHVSPAEATEAIANKYKQFFPAQTPQAAATQMPQAQPAAPQRPATLPNLGSSNVSAIKSKPKSIDDLRKLAREA